MFMRARMALVACVFLTVATRAGAVELVVHRGDNGHAPENTLAAAQRCIDMGIEYLEFDVRRSQDGVHYVLHDPTVDRTTDGTGAIRSLTSGQVDALDAGIWFSEEFAGERVPRLEALLDLCRGRIKLYFDVKDADLEYLVGLVRDRGLESECFFWFGNKTMALRFRELTPDLELKVNVSTPAEAREAKRELGATLIECNVRNLTPEFIQTCRDLELRIMVREGQPDEEAFRRTVEAGADLINLDHPELFLRVQTEIRGETE
jgi:glycerophosphoryl diester phosphodiesterase